MPSFTSVPRERPYHWLLSTNAASSRWPEWRSSTGAIARSHYNSRRTVGGRARVPLCLCTVSRRGVDLAFSLSHFDLTAARDS